MLAPRSCRYLILGVFLALAPSRAEAGNRPLSIWLEGQSCLTPEQILRTLEQRFTKGSVILGQARIGEPSIRLRAESSSRLTITFLDGTDGPPAQRILSITASDCPELPLTIALLVESWLQRLPSLGGAIVSERPPSPAPAKADLGLPRQPESRVEPPHSVDSLELRAPSSNEANAPPTSSQEETSAAAPGDTSFRATLLGGLSLSGAGSQASFHGLGDLDLSLSRRCGLALDMGWEPSLGMSTSSGSVTVSSLSLALFGRLILWPTTWGGVDFRSGVGLERLSASSAGYAINRETVLWDAGFWGVAAGRLKIAGPVFAVVSAGLHLRPRKESFEIAGLGSVLQLSPLRFSMLAGIGANLF